MGSTQEPWRQIVTQKRAARDKLLAPYLVDDIDQRQPRVHRVDERSRLNDPEAQRITEVDGIEELSQSLQKGEFTAEQVTKAYIKR